MKRVLATCVFLAVAWGCAHVSDVTADWDRGTDFSRFETFAFSDKGMPFINKKGGEAVRELIAAELGTKGFRQVDADEADFMVVLFPREKNGLRVDWYSIGYMPWWGLWGGGYAMNTRYTDIKIGSLMVDIVDVENQRLVWRGVADIEMAQDVKRSIDRIVGIIEKLFKDFPPAS